MLIKSDQIGSGSGATTFTGLTDTPAAYTGQALRRPRVNDGATVLEFDYDGVDIINVEEARSDIRSTTRTGYSTYNSYAGLQALVNSAGDNKVFYFPANGVFNLGGNLLKTAGHGQGFVSFGKGAEIDDGGFEIYTRRCVLQNLRLTGTSTNGYGIHITEPSYSQLGTLPPATYPHEYSTFLVAQNIEIRNKTWAIYNNTASGLNRFFNVNTFQCTNGVYINHSDFASDSGDWHFTMCRFTGGSVAPYTGTGAHIVKIGGLVFTDTKFQQWDIGLLLEPDAAACAIATSPPIQGTYLTGCEFEDCQTWEVKISAGAGVAAADYPRWTQIVGGTTHRMLLDKAVQTSIHGILTNIALQINTGASQVEIYGAPYIALSGAGTDYIIVGNDSTRGPHIRVGAQLKLYDAANPTGKVL